MPADSGGFLCLWATATVSMAQSLRREVAWPAGSVHDFAPG